jgi:dipeptidyl aminopeptidase/acylaminoacyl peptidase
MNRLLKQLLFTVPIIFYLVVSSPAASEDLMSPQKIAEIKTVTGAEISPDGRYIAYTLSIPRLPWKDEDGTPWQNLHVINTEDGSSRLFIGGEANFSSVQWTPDGKWISFLAKREGDKFQTLYTLPLDGGEARVAVSMESDIMSYSWSPDGRSVALMALEPEKKEVKELKDKGFKQIIYEEDWRQRNLYIADTFSEDAPKHLELPGAVFSVDWGHGANQIAVSLAPTPSTDDSYMSKKVHIVDAQSGKVLSKLENPGKLGKIVWSPDGKQLAMISGADINDPADGRLLVGDVNGGVLRDILNNHPGHVADVAWTPEGIVMINGEGVWTAVELVNPKNGSRSKKVSFGGPILQSLSVSSKGTMAFVANSPDHPGEVYYLGAGTSEPERMTDSNPWLKQVRLAKQEVVQFKARDGLDLEGILIHPIQEEPGKKYPLVLVVHGGPEAHHSNGWLTSYSNLGQMAAASGIATFYTNYRGSTGRGVEFSKLSQADPAGKEFDDLVDAVDHLIDTGLVDPEKVGITGGSYGGYATAWCTTYYSDRFAAGVMFVGISNKISKVGTTDIPDEEYLVHARKRPWDDWQFFLDRSPVYHAEKSKTPLLILHGLDDPRVNVGQSREMYRHLKLRGKAPVRLVFYPGEGHGNRRAAARYDYSLRAMRWLEHYLKGEGGNPPEWSIDYEFPE